MDESAARNLAVLRGTLSAPPALSHTSRGERFYIMTLETRRLSGTADRINVIARESLLNAAEVLEAGRIEVRGELRSFNNKSGTGAKLVISVFAKELFFADGPDVNSVRLSGTICKPPTPTSASSFCVTSRTSAPRSRISTSSPSSRGGICPSSSPRSRRPPPRRPSSRRRRSPRPPRPANQQSNHQGRRKISCRN